MIHDTSLRDRFTLQRTLGRLAFVLHIIQFIFKPWIRTGLQNPYGYGSDFGMIGEQIRDVHCSIPCYVFIQRTESLQHVDIISDTFRSPISSCF
jgi:hypothetical protein